MTNLLEIQYTKEKNIIVEVEDFVYFTGGNIQMKQSIISCLNRFSIGKILNDAEENIFGENGINITYNDKLLNTKDVVIMNINNYSSILNELIVKKGSLLHGELMNLGNDLDIMIQMEKINNELITLESIVTDKMELLFNNNSYQFKDLLFADLLNKQIEILYNEKGVEIPLEFRTPSSLNEEFIKLVENFVNRTGKMIWIILDQPFNFLTTEDFDKFFKELLIIAEETKLLNIFIFNNDQNVSNYLMDIEKTVLLYSNYQQLPKYEVFSKSIERNYPDELTLSENELLSSLFRICHLVGKDIDMKYSISPRDMILLIILKKLLGDYSVIETSNIDLTPIERSFLNSYT